MGFFRKRSQSRKRKDAGLASYQGIGEDTFEGPSDSIHSREGHKAYRNSDGNVEVNVNVNVDGMGSFDIQPDLALTQSSTHDNDGGRDRDHRGLKSSGSDVDGLGLKTNGENSYDDNCESNAGEASVSSQDVSLEELPRLVNDLANCGANCEEETYGEIPARALRALFALSEHHDLHEINRIRMVREANGQLVPTLIAFLQMCEPNSSEQYLALLVLNNVSIPSENKRMVAIDHKGAHVLSRLLCWYPSSSLVCIILVNLTFCEQGLRQLLVEDGSSIQLVEAFAYALKVSISPEGTTPPEILQKDTPPRQLLLNLQLQQDGETSNSLSTNHHRISAPFNPDAIAFPETARWALCGMKNLTRPSRDPIAAHALVQSGVLHMILRVLTIGSGSQRQASNEFHMFSSNEYKGINIKQQNQWRNQNRRQQSRDDEDGYGYDSESRNDPYTWDSNSMQDAALYVLMNFAITPGTRPHVKNDHVARMLALVARYSSSPPPQGLENGLKDGKERQKNLQCLKARMALAYIFGSEGNFGQVPSSGVYVDRNEDLKLKGVEAPLLVELLSNTLHGRGKKGPGGYNASTFNAKKALFAIRCLLTHSLNVNTFFVTCGIKLNILLLKTLALHSIQEVAHVDMEAAEDAVWSLYLLSKFGFMGSFLPPAEDGYPLEQILDCYLRKRDTCTAAGQHAARQLLLRYPYMNFNGNSQDDEPANLIDSDLELGHALLHAAETMEVESDFMGEQPLDDIFGRPLTRQMIPNGSNGGNGKTMMTPWESSRSAVSSFNSALDAVQEFSFKLNTLDGNMESIDDIQIANNIAKCANGKISQCYGYEWSWQDGGGGIHEREVRQKLRDFRSGKLEGFKGLLKNVNVRREEPISLFGFNCGCNSRVVD